MKQIITILRESESGAMPMKSFYNITKRKFFRWRNTYGGMDVSDARHPKDFGTENALLKRIVAEQLLVIDEMTEIVQKVTYPSVRRESILTLVRGGTSQGKAFRCLGLSRRVTGYAPDAADSEHANPQATATSSTLGQPHSLAGRRSLERRLELRLRPLSDGRWPLAEVAVPHRRVQPTMPSHRNQGRACERRT
jgi:putative transposase